MLSKLGYCSRSRAFQLIRDGRVKLDGRVQRDPKHPATLKQAIEVDGRVVSATEKLYLMMNKPRGLVTTTADERGRETVYSLLDPALPWVAPVGRLDKASEGLLLFTNDCEWAARITAPDSHVEKTYHVQIDTVADASLLYRLTSGVRDGGDFLAAKRASVLREGQRNSWLELVLDEGKNRHIRRLMAVENIEVLRLVRVAIGPLQLGDLAKGQVRQLTKVEGLTWREPKG